MLGLIWVQTVCKKYQWITLGDKKLRPLSEAKINDVIVQFLLIGFISSYPTNIFVLKMSSAAYIQVYFRLDFIMEANTMTPDQTAV